MINLMVCYIFESIRAEAKLNRSLIDHFKTQLTQFTSKELIFIANKTYK